MKAKLIYIVAAFLTFAASSATTTRQPKAHIQIIYQGTDNGDYRLYLFGSKRALVCEEKEIKVVQQGDAVSPLVIECSHGGAK